MIFEMFTDTEKVILEMFLKELLFEKHVVSIVLPYVFFYSVLYLFSIYLLIKAFFYYLSLWSHLCN